MSRSRRSGRGRGKRVLETQTDSFFSEKPVEGHLHESLRLYTICKMMKWTHLPASGGLYDQHPKFLDDLITIAQIEGRIEQGRQKKREADMKRKSPSRAGGEQDVVGSGLQPQHHDSSQRTAGAAAVARSSASNSIRCRTWLGKKPTDPPARCPARGRQRSPSATPLRRRRRRRWRRPLRPRVRQAERRRQSHRMMVNQQKRSSRSCAGSRRRNARRQQQQVHLDAISSDRRRRPRSPTVRR